VPRIQFSKNFAEDTAMSFNVPDDCVFGPEATALMGEVFEAACEELHPSHKWARELIATRIIAAARRGELDPLHLRSAALVGISHNVLLKAG
jgi:hypothetical protein